MHMIVSKILVQYVRVLIFFHILQSCIFIYIAARQTNNIETNILNM